MDLDKEHLRTLQSEREDTKSPLHYLKHPPNSYKEWLAFISDTIPSDNNQKTGNAEKEDTSLSSTQVGKHVELPYQSICLDTLMLNLEKQSRDGKHVSGRADTVLGTLDDIKANLRQNAPYDSTFLDDIDRRLRKVQELLHECSSWFIDTNFRKKCHQKKMLTDSNEELLTARNVRLQQRGGQSAKSRDPSEEGGRKSVQSVTFPGLNNEEMVSFPLPGTLDALSILNLVTQYSSVRATLMGPWKKMFLCAASTSILQLYPLYLAQALFSCFCQAFPGPNEKINSVEFLNYLSNTTSEWIKGVKSRPDEWRRWPKHVLNPNSVLLPVEKREGMPTTVPSTSLSSAVSSADKIMGSPCQQKTFSLSNITVQQGPIFERVQFSIHGRSPLLTHFLHHHHLIEQKGDHGPAMSRTEIMENPPLGTSYSEVFRCYVQKTKGLFKEYESAMAQSEQRIMMAKKKLLKGLNKMEKKNQCILQQQHEVTHMAKEISTNTESKIYECSTPSEDDP